MKIVFLATLFCVILLMAGCVRKGPYYIYGDYYEGNTEDELEAVDGGE
ncbi:MAG: lipopeptide [Candidatus Aureabacteria bacterium]|nr:lipopeptide [Candidatus Auribacterota bacterium]